MAMKLPFAEDPKKHEGISGAARDEVLAELCTRHHTVILATPYLNFESRFLGREGDHLLVWATMGREVVKNTLIQQAVKLRFPWALTLYAGQTRIVEYEQGEKNRALRVLVPERLFIDEQRRSYRAERVGRSWGALGAITGEDVAIVQVNLENLSLYGAGVFCLESAPGEAFMPGRKIQVSLTLEDGPSLSAGGRVCHSNGSYMGIEFVPPLQGETAERVAAWIAVRKQEAQRRWDNRFELRARAEEAAKPKPLPSGVLMISSDAELIELVGGALEGLHKVRSVPSAMAPYRQALNQRPVAVLVDCTGLGLEARHRLKTMLESAPPGCPIMVLIRSAADMDGARILAADLKTPAPFTWNASAIPFFRRLVEGLIRKHWKPGEYEAGNGE